MLIRRDKRGRSPWLAAGTIVGALLGYGMAPIRLKASDDLVRAVWALAGAILGLGVGIVLDIRNNCRQKLVGNGPSPAGDEAQGEHRRGASGAQTIGHFAEQEHPADGS